MEGICYNVKETNEILMKEHMPILKAESKAKNEALCMEAISLIFHYRGWSEGMCGP